MLGTGESLRTEGILGTLGTGRMLGVGGTLEHWEQGQHWEQQEQQLRVNMCTVYSVYFKHA